MQVCASCKDVARDNASFVPAAPRWLGLLLLLQRPENAHGMPMRPFTLAFFSLKTIVHIRIFSSFFLFLLPLVTWTRKHVFVQKTSTNTHLIFLKIYHFMFHFMSSLGTWNFVILVLIILKKHSWLCYFYKLVIIERIWCIYKN